MIYLLIIPLGMLLIILVGVSIFFKKVTKNNSLLCISITLLILAILIATFIGVSYPCPCGCGSEETAVGLKGIYYLFVNSAMDSLLLNIFYFIVYALFIFIILFFAIKFLTKNK